MKIQKKKKASPQQNSKATNNKIRKAKKRRGWGETFDMDWKKYYPNREVSYTRKKLTSTQERERERNDKKKKENKKENHLAQVLYSAWATHTVQRMLVPEGWELLRESTVWWPHISCTCSSSLVGCLFHFVCPHLLANNNNTKKHTHTERNFLFVFFNVNI